MKKYLPFILLLALIIIPHTSYAQTTFNFDVVEEIREQIEYNSNIWIGHIKKVALNLFYILALISFVSKFILDVMSKGEIDSKDSISYIIRFIFTTGFFYFLLDNGVELATSIVASFTMLGERAVGLKPTFTNLISVGFDLLVAGDNIGWSDFEIKIPFFVLAVLTLLFLIIITANLIIEEIAAAIMIYVGFFVLAFGGMEYTRESAINYFKAILGISLKILTIILIMGITIQIMNSLEYNLKINAKNSTEGGVIIYQALIAFLTVFFLALLSMKLPDAISNLVSNAWGNMSGLTLMGGIALAQSTASKVASMVASGGQAGKNIITGYKDYNKNKEIGIKKKEAEKRGEDTSLNPMYNKQKNSSGKAYYGGKAIAAVSDKLGSIFGNSNEMSSSSDNTNGNTDNNTKINNINNMNNKDSNKDEK